MRLFEEFFPSEYQAFFSDRSTDFSFSGENDFYLTDGQKAAVEQACPGAAGGMVTVRQVHGREVLPEAACVPGRVSDADGAVTGRPATALSIRTADCLPVFAVDPEGKRIGIAHAGWRGSRQGIAAGLVAAMAQAGSKPADLLVGFGPAIRVCCYEVGPEFREWFDTGEERHGRFYLDLAGFNRRQLTAAGVRPERIADCGLCTGCREEFYSYRREGAAAGRHLSWLVRYGR